MKESYPPGIFKPDELSAIVSVDDDSAYETARRLAREEGIFVGMSAGAAMKVAIDEARSLGQGAVVALLPDGGERYLSTSLFVSETVPEPLRFYNTLPRCVQQLDPVSPGKVTIYSCGPSLDGPPDLGLCRRMVFADVLRRYLEYRGYQVNHAVNLGDIDDRTVKECLKTGGKWKELHGPLGASLLRGPRHPSRPPRAPLPQGQRARRRHGGRDPRPAGKRTGLRETALGLLPHQQFRGLRQAVGNRAEADAERRFDHLRLLREGPPRRLRPLQASHAGGVEGGHLLADSLGQRPARLARRVRLHGRALPGPADRHPHRQHRPDLSSRRQRNRHRLRAEGQAAGPPLAALRGGHGRWKESEPRSRQRPHPRDIVGAGLRRPGDPLLAAGHPLPHGVALFVRGAPAGGPVRGAAQRVRLATGAFSAGPAEPRNPPDPPSGPGRLAGGPGQRPQCAQGLGPAVRVQPPGQPAAECRRAGRRPGPAGARLHAPGGCRAGRDRLRSARGGPRGCPS